MEVYAKKVVSNSGVTILAFKPAECLRKNLELREEKI
jgi:hypothetical protein